MKPIKQQSNLSRHFGDRRSKPIVEFPQDIERANAIDLTASPAEDDLAKEMRRLRKELRGLHPRDRARLIRENLMGPQL